MSSVEALRDILRFLNAREFGLGNDRSQIGRTQLGFDYSDGGDGPLHIVGDAIVATYASLLLGSSFQPIVAWDDRVVGYKALVTAKSASHRDYRLLYLPNISKLALATSDRDDVIYRDRLTRTMHVLNYLSSGSSEDLYLIVNPQHLQAVHKNHGEVFERILAQCGLAPDRIVLEIPEYAVSDKRHLRAAIAAWQKRHYRIAIDVGAAPTQLTSVLSLEPEIIKFNGSFVASLSESAVSQQQLEKTIESIRANGVRTVVAGIDSGDLYDMVRKYSFFALQGKWLVDRVAVAY